MKYNAGMKAYYKDIAIAIKSMLGKQGLEEIRELADGSSPVPLREYLKENHGKSHHSGSCHDENSEPPFMFACSPQNFILEYDHAINNSGDEDLTLTWSQVVVFIKGKKELIFDDFDTNDHSNAADCKTSYFEALKAVYPNLTIENLLDNPEYDFCPGDFFEGADFLYNTNAERCDGDCERCWKQQAEFEYNPKEDVTIPEEWKAEDIKGESAFPCDNCAHDDNGCCDYPDTPDDYCVCGDKQIPVTAEDNSPIDLPESESETQSARHIIDIPVDHIHPHPDNPRKDVGDVTELADSIKENGIMQNLTVVPWFSELTRMPASDHSMDDYYRVIIGHRRLAAAKMAGLETVPCVLSDADRKQQIAIMLAENMQRTDLTIIEQADGIQMMFDMGADIDEVSEKTGLSKTTVRRRTKLLEYDRDALKGAMERGATFADYDKLNQIKSIARRNEVLETIGTSNFTYKLNSAITAEKSETGLPIAEKWLSGFAEKVKSYLEIPTGTYHYFKTLYPHEFADENYVEHLSLPPSVGELKYLYYINGSRLELYQERTQSVKKTDNSAEEAAQPIQSKYEQQRKRKVELDQLSKLMYQMRYDWVKDWNPNKSNAAEELKALTEAAITASVYSLDVYEISLANILGVDIDDLDTDDDNYYSQVINRIMTSDIPMHKIMLTWIYTASDNGHQDYHTWSAEHESNEGLDLIYKLLVALGYPMSDDERAYQNGTHDAFKE